MKRIFLFVILVGTVLTSFSNSLSSLWSRTIYAQEVASDVTQQQMILAASIQIVMFGQVTADQPIATMARGLGTLVHHEGQTLIVTHDHWGNLVVTANQVELRDAHNHLFLTLDGTRFRNLIRYRDEGTMILTAPAGLPLEQATFLSEDEVRTGSTVMVARRQKHPDGRVTVETMPATVSAVEQREERPIYILRSLDGQPIVQGDSGGGVWWDGRLIGNTWATEMITGWRLGHWSIHSDGATSDISITAQFPQLSPQGEVVTGLLASNQITQIHSGVRE